MHRLLPLLSILVACATGPARAPATLPTGWDECSPRAFEELAASVEPAALSEASLDELARGLSTGGETAVRAAVLLGRVGGRDAAELLLRRLEERAVHAERSADAGDVVAAAALATLVGLPRSEARPRLRALAVGPSPHPDLEVRVECARSALALGDAQVVPFLLRVLVIGTPLGSSLPSDFERKTATAWARGRAARALEARLGWPRTYRADAPLGERERAARRLAAAFGRELVGP